MKISTFFNSDYVNFSSYDNLRKIASLVDGQKNSSRKILHTILEKNIKEKIKVSQLGSKVAEFCLVGDTLVNTVEFGLITIFELVNKDINEFHVYSIDENGKEVVGLAKHARFMKNTNELIEIKTENDTIACTPDHKILIKENDNMIWKEAQYITENDFIVNI